MKLPRPTDTDKDRFRELVPSDPRVEVKPMFGHLAAFVNGNMFFGLFGSDLGVKLAEVDLAEVTAAGGGPFGPQDRPMSGYVTLPPGDPSAWIDKALAYVAGLPPKKPRTKK